MATRSIGAVSSWPMATGGNRAAQEKRDAISIDISVHINACFARYRLRAQTPAAFAHDETIEVATADESYSATLSLSNGGMTLENARVAVATLDPTKVLGSSAFGPLRFRVIANGAAGDWQPLATLVRLPVLKDLQCPSSLELACKLSGSNLYLVDSVSSDPQFDHPIQVPDGFPGYALPVPRPTGGRIYVRLRDNPAVVNPVELTAVQLPPSPEESARADARLAAAPAANPPTADSGDNQPSATSSPQTPALPPAPPARSAPAQPQAREIAPAAGPQDGAPGDLASKDSPKVANTP